MIASKSLSFSLSLLISLHVLCLITPTDRPVNTRVLSASSFISDAKTTLDSIGEGIAGTARFVERVSGFFEMVVSFAGFRAIVLLMAVMIIASLFSFMGIPRGAFSFFLSLLCADALWMAWHKSFQPLEWDFVLTLVKTNLVLAAPFLAVSLFAATSRPLVSKAGYVLRGLMNRMVPGRRKYSRDKLVEMLELYRKNNAEFELSLLQDIINSGNDAAAVSHRTRRLAGEVLRITGEIGGNTGGKVKKGKTGSDDTK